MIRNRYQNVRLPRNSNNYRTIFGQRNETPSRTKHRQAEGGAYCAAQISYDVSNASLLVKKMQWKFSFRIQNRQISVQTGRSPRRNARTFKRPECHSMIPWRVLLVPILDRFRFTRGGNSDANNLQHAGHHKETFGIQGMDLQFQELERCYLWFTQCKVQPAL